MGFFSLHPSSMLAVIVLCLIASIECCNQYSGCLLVETCCSNRCRYGDDCIGLSCDESSDCAIGETCCSQVCKMGDSCEGELCDDDDDCGYLENCCDGTCKPSGTCSYVSTAIIASLGGAFAFICLVAVAICFICRRRGLAPRYERVIVGSRVIHAPPQSNRAYPEQAATSYQQGNPCYAAPQYAQFPPPYTPHASRVSERRPPPYTQVANKESGGVSNPQHSYGTMTIPSAPAL